MSDEETPQRLTRRDLKALSPEDVIAAFERGELQHLLTKQVEKGPLRKMLEGRSGEQIVELLNDNQFMRDLADEQRQAAA